MENHQQDLTWTWKHTLTACLMPLLLVVGSSLLLGMLFFLYGLPWEVWLIFSVIEGVVCLLLVPYFYHLHKQMERMVKTDQFTPENYPPICRPLVSRLAREQQGRLELASQYGQAKRDLHDYVSLWAHEIKLPLAALTMQLSLSEPNIKEMQSCARRIDHSITRMLAFIRLDGSDYRFEPVDLETAIRSIIRSNASLFITHHIRVEVEDQGNGDPVISDQKWASFVLEQLLANALKYSPDHSMIRILINNQTIEIIDEGCGIDAQDLPRIFEKGFTGKNGRADQVASSGLGLYLCDRICKALNCKLSITNRTSQKGTIARIEFPAPRLV